MTTLGLPTRSIEVPDDGNSNGVPDIDCDLHPWAEKLPNDESGFTGNTDFAFDAAGLTEEDAVLQMAVAVISLLEAYPDAVFKFGSAFMHNINNRTQSTEQCPRKHFHSGSTEGRFLLGKDIATKQATLTCEEVGINCEKAVNHL